MTNQKSKFQLDHTVHYVNDLEEAKAAFQKHGVNVFHGGSHKLWGTHNALAYFELTYLEFISVENWETAKNPPEPNLIAQSALTYLPEQEALSRIAVRTDDLDAVSDSLKGSGLDVSPIKQGKRTDSEGRLIEWRMLTIDGNYNGLLYPFFIEWKEADPERLKALQQKGLTTHPAGDISLEKAVMETTDPEAAVRNWHELFGFETISPVEIQLDGKIVHFKKGTAGRLTELHFQTNNSALAGTVVTLGSGRYVFSQS
jgi:hypothetical protein